MKKIWILILIYGLSISAYAGILPDFSENSKKKAHNPPEMEVGIPTMIQKEVLAFEEDQITKALQAQFDKEKEAEQKAKAKLENEIRDDAAMLSDHPIAKKYAGLVQQTKGKFYSALEKPLLMTVWELLQEQLVDDADVVFVIDHTSSMEDDIDEVRYGMETIIEGLQRRKGVRAGLVTFSDVKSGSKFGYCARDLSTDYMGMRAFLGKIELLGSIEDVYGAIWKTVDEFSWQSKTKRLIVLISDEKPAIGEDTNYSEEEVIVKCLKHKVDTNLYPILVDKYKETKE